MYDSRIHSNMKIAWNDSAVKLGCFYTTITVNRHDELAAMDLSMIAVALKPSWLAWNLTIVPVWLYFS